MLGTSRRRDCVGGFFRQNARLPAKTASDNDSAGFSTQVARTTKFGTRRGSRFSCETAPPERVLRAGHRAACTKSGHAFVEPPHSAAFKEVTNRRFSLTLKTEGVKRQSFFDTFWSLSGWCGVRGSSEATLRHRKMKSGEGEQGSTAKRWSRGTRTPCQRQDRVPRRWTGFSGWR